MLSIYQTLKTTLKARFPYLQYIDWERGQMDEEDTPIVPPALLLQLSADWEGEDAAVTLVVKLWIMHYADTYADTEAEDEAYKKARDILAVIDTISGARFNTLQRKQERIMSEYKGLAIEVTYMCNMRKG